MRWVLRTMPRSWAAAKVVKPGVLPVGRSFALTPFVVGRASGVERCASVVPGLLAEIGLVGLGGIDGRVGPPPLLCHPLLSHPPLHPRGPGGRPLLCRAPARAPSAR